MALIFLLALYFCSLGIWISLICRQTTFRFLLFSHSFISQTFLYYYSSVSVWRAFLHQQLEASCCVGFSIWTAFFLAFFVYCISPEIHFIWAWPFLWLHSENFGPLWWKPQSRLPLSCWLFVPVLFTMIVLSSRDRIFVT